jgi:hypothetical protein
MLTIQTFYERKLLSAIIQLSRLFLIDKWVQWDNLSKETADYFYFFHTSDVCFLMS